jgi:glycerol dehydratase small subunit/propanediol dehydratase small subunit
MSRGIRDYPLAETQPEKIRGAGGLSLADVTLDAVLEGRVSMEDLRITPEALRAQAEIARSAGRPTLARNFERAAELVSVPQDFLMEVYELLRPGRARAKEPLLAAAHRMRTEFGASLIAEFIEEAAGTYEERGLFTYRF